MPRSQTTTKTAKETDETTHAEDQIKLRVEPTQEKAHLPDPISDQTFTTNGEKYGVLRFADGLPSHRQRSYPNSCRLRKTGG